MNTGHINDIITMVKEDKTIMQPFKNYAIKELHVAIALIEQGKRTSNLTPPAGTPVGSIPALPAAKTCICPPGVTDKSCPVHG